MAKGLEELAAMAQQNPQAQAPETQPATGPSGGLADLANMAASLTPAKVVKPWVANPSSQYPTEDIDNAIHQQAQQLANSQVDLSGVQDPYASQLPATATAKERLADLALSQRVARSHLKKPVGPGEEPSQDLLILAKQYRLADELRPQVKDEEAKAAHTLDQQDDLQRISTLADVDVQVKNGQDKATAQKIHDMLGNADVAPADKLAMAAQLRGQADTAGGEVSHYNDIVNQQRWLMLTGLSEALTADANGTWQQYLGQGNLDADKRKDLPAGFKTAPNWFAHQARRTGASIVKAGVSLVADIKTAIDDAGKLMGQDPHRPIDAMDWQPNAGFEPGSQLTKDGKVLATIPKPEKVQSLVEKVDQWIQDHPDYQPHGTGEEVASGVTEMVPLIAAATVDPWLGAGMMYMQGRRSGEETAKSMGMSDDNSAWYGRANGLVQAAIAKVPLSKMAGMMKSTGTASIDEAMAAITKGIVPKIIQQTPTAAAHLVDAAITNMVAMPAGSLVQEMPAALITGKEPVGGWKEFETRLVTSAGTGLAAAIVFGGPSLAKAARDDRKVAQAVRIAADAQERGKAQTAQPAAEPKGPLAELQALIRQDQTQNAAGGPQEPVGQKSDPTGQGDAQTAPKATPGAKTGLQKLTGDAYDQARTDAIEVLADQSPQFQANEEAMNQLDPTQPADHQQLQALLQVNESLIAAQMANDGVAHQSMQEPAKAPQPVVAPVESPTQKPLEVVPDAAARPAEAPAEPARPIETTTPEEPARFVQRVEQRVKEANGGRLPIWWEDGVKSPDDEYMDGWTYRQTMEAELKALGADPAELAKFWQGVKPAEPVAPANHSNTDSVSFDPSQVAKQLGVRYDGPQLKQGGKFYGHTFTDPTTDSSFIVKPGEDPAAKLQRSRANWKAEQAKAKIRHPDAKPAQPVTFGRDEFIKLLDRYVKGTRQGEAIVSIYDAVAKTWGERTGRPASEFYSEKVSRVKEGPATADEMKYPEVRKGTARGYYDVLKDGVKLLRLFENADGGTFLHELYHMMSETPGVFNAADMAVLEKFAGVKDGKWTKPQKDKVANAFVGYFTKGRVPKDMPQLRRIFQTLKAMIVDIYKGLKGNPSRIRISAEVENVFARALGSKRTMEQATEEKQRQIDTQRVRQETKQLEGEIRQWHKSVFGEDVADELERLTAGTDEHEGMVSTFAKAFPGEVKTWLAQKVKAREYAKNPQLRNVKVAPWKIDKEAERYGLQQNKGRVGGGTTAEDFASSIGGYDEYFRRLEALHDGTEKIVAEIVDRVEKAARAMPDVEMLAKARRWKILQQQGVEGLTMQPDVSDVEPMGFAPDGDQPIQPSPVIGIVNEVLMEMTRGQLLNNEQAIKARLRDLSLDELGDMGAILSEEAGDVANLLRDWTMEESAKRVGVEPNQSLNPETEAPAPEQNLVSADRDFASEKAARIFWNTRAKKNNPGSTPIIEPSPYQEGRWRLRWTEAPTVFETAKGLQELGATADVAAGIASKVSPDARTELSSIMSDMRLIAEEKAARAKIKEGVKVKTPNGDVGTVELFGPNDSPAGRGLSDNEIVVSIEGEHGTMHSRFSWWQVDPIGETGVSQNQEIQRSIETLQADNPAGRLPDGRPVDAQTALEVSKEASPPKGQPIADPEQGPVDMFGQPIRTAITGKQQDLGVDAGKVKGPAVGSVEIKDTLAKEANRLILADSSIHTPGDLYMAILSKYKASAASFFRDAKNPMPEVTEALTRATNGGPLFEERLRPKEIKIDLLQMRDADLAAISRKMKAKGYDSRGADDARQALERMLDRGNGQHITHPDWIDAIMSVKESKAKRVVNAEQKAKTKAEYKNVDWARVRELGTTSNWREAGYITPTGSLVDLSGKKGIGERGLDHREVGGTVGMQEMIASGYVRIDATAGLIDVRKEPTPEQYRIIRHMLQQLHGHITVDLQDGLGEPRLTEEGGKAHTEYYYNAERSDMGRYYQNGTKPDRIINEIKRFFAGEDLPPLAEHDSGPVFENRPTNPQYGAGGLQRDLEIQPVKETADVGEMRTGLQGDLGLEPVGVKTEGNLKPWTARTQRTFMIDDRMMPGVTDKALLVDQIKRTIKERGLAQSLWRQVVKDVTGEVDLNPSRLQAKELQVVLYQLLRSRPMRVEGKRVITRQTARKIVTLQQNLAQTGQSTAAEFARQKHELGLQATDYENARRFATETQGNQLIRKMLTEAPMIRRELERSKALEQNPALAKVVGLIRQQVEKSRGKARVMRTVDMRYVAQQMEAHSGLPFYSAWSAMNDAHLQVLRMVEDNLRVIEQSTPRYQKILDDDKALQRVSDYIASRLPDFYDNKPGVPADITPDEIKMADAISSVLKPFEKQVRQVRFMQWYYENKPIGNAPKSDLERAKQIYETQGPAALQEYLAGRTWGVIRDGYEPHEIVRHMVGQPTPGTASFAKGHTGSREETYPWEQERNIVQRVSAYMHQMLNLSVLQPEVRALHGLFNDNPHAFGADRQTVAQILETAIKEAKGERWERGYWQKLIYGMAARATFWDPRKWFRNMPWQNIAYNQDKGLRDFISSFRRMSPRERGYFDTYISQEYGIRYHMMQAGEEDVGPRLLKAVNRFVDKTNLYGWTDELNRHRAFTSKVDRVGRALAEYDKTGNVERLLKQSGVLAFQPLEQSRMLEILAQKGKDAFAYEIAREHTNQVHFVMDRAQRAPLEMGNRGRVLTNLLTFPRSAAVRLLQAGKKVATGRTMAERATGLKVLLQMSAGAYASGWILRHILGTQSNAYDPLELLGWQVGGLSTGSINEALGMSDDIVKAIRGDRQALSMLPTAISRVDKLFIPLYAQIVNLIEAATSTQNIDVYALRKVRALFDASYNPKDPHVDRTWQQHVQKWMFGGKPENVDKVPGQTSSSKKPAGGGMFSTSRSSTGKSSKSSGGMFGN